MGVGITSGIRPVAASTVKVLYGPVKAGDRGCRSVRRVIRMEGEVNQQYNVSVELRDSFLSDRLHSSRFPASTHALD